MLILIALLIVLPMLGRDFEVRSQHHFKVSSIASSAVIDLILRVTGNV